jgi:hypothetical protein
MICRSQINIDKESDEMALIVESYAYQVKSS